MTVEQLNATPLYSIVDYMGDRYTIIKIKNGAAKLWDPYPGNVSVYIQAAELYLHEYFEPYHRNHTFTPTSIFTAPIYWPVSVGGKAGVIVGIEMRSDEATFPNAVYVATVFFPATETFGEFRDGDLIFATYIPSPMIIQPPVIQPPTITPIIMPPVITPITPYVPPVITPITPYVPPVITPITPVTPPVITPITPYVPPVITPITPVTPPVTPINSKYILYGAIAIGVLLFF